MADERVPFLSPAGELSRPIHLPGERQPRLAALSDVHGWAFCQQMHDLEVYVGRYFEVTHLYVADWLKGLSPVPNLRHFDVIYCPYHRWDSPQLPLHVLLPWDRTLGSLRSQWLFPERKCSPGAEEFQVVNRYAAFNVVTLDNYAEYAKDCPSLWYLTNPVNMRRFPTTTPRRSEVVASWNGNAGHSNILGEDVKGFYSIIRPACTRARVPLVFAEYEMCKRAPAEMPEFYQQANVALCASIYEGASSSIMEAMASGLAVISTDCGNTREMQRSQLRRYGQTGIRIVERSIDAFVQELHSLAGDVALVAEMGEVNRESIAQDWSWGVWAEGFIEFFLTPLRDRG